MRSFLFFLCLIVSNYFFCGDSISNKLGIKRLLFLDVGYSLNYSKISSTQFSSPIDFELKPFRSVSYSIGYIKSRRNYFAGIKIKHVSIGDKQSLNASFNGGAPTNIYVSSSKPNFFLGIFAGISFKIGKIEISPYLGGEYSLTPRLNSDVGGIFSIENDSLFVTKRTKLISNKILLLNSGFFVTVPIKIGKTKFYIAYNLSCSIGFENVYFSNTRFYSKNSEYIFLNNNKGTHVINAVQLYVPLTNK